MMEIKKFGKEMDKNLSIFDYLKSVMRQNIPRSVRLKVKVKERMKVKVKVKVSKNIGEFLTYGVLNK